MGMGPVVPEPERGRGGGAQEGAPGARAGSLKAEGGEQETRLILEWRGPAGSFTQRHTMTKMPRSVPASGRTEDTSQAFREGLRGWSRADSAGRAARVP